MGNLKNSLVKGFLPNNGQNVRNAQRIGAFAVSTPRPEEVMDKTVTRT